MIIPSQHEKELARFPALLRDLVMAELAIGNTITELSHGFPAAPCGAYIALAREVTTRARVKTTELAFYDRNNGSYSGEFTDALRHFFVVEPPRPPEPPPDMDAIRAEIEARERASNSAREAPAEHALWDHMMHDSTSLLPRFKASMDINYDKWREGIGYDLDLIAQANPDEREAIEDLLILRHNSDWRDVEALAAIGSPRAHEFIKGALASTDTRVQMAVHAYAPQLMTESERVRSLVQVLEQSDFRGGLTQALLEVETFHPPEIMTTLFRGLINAEGGIACHFAAMLYFLPGKASSSFDWNHRPLFLRFNTPNMLERERAARELCAHIGVESSRCVKP